MYGTIKRIMNEKEADVGRVRNYGFMVPKIYWKENTKNSRIQASEMHA
jgi:hypothetical protein